MEVAGGVALVTGAAGGIGAALAARLADAGATVVTADLPGQGADLALDVTNADAVDAAVAGVVERHGRVDVVAAVAGVGVGGLVEDLALEDWRRAIDCNIWGTVHTVRAAYPHLMAQRTGHLLLMASLAGLVPTPLLVPYATSKAAIVGLATSLRPEAARHGIGVSVVCPGPVETPLLCDGGSRGIVRGIDARRYLERAAGRAVSPDVVALAALRAIRRNRAVVAPKRAGGAWRAARLSPRASEAIITRAMRAELRDAD